MSTETKRWQAIFRELPACVAITRGPSHTLEFTNAAYDRSSNSRDVVGKCLGDAHPELHRQGIIDLADKIFREAIPFSSNEFPAEIDFPDGTKETRYFNGTIIPLKDEQGIVEGLVNFQYDVTTFVENRKQLQKTKEQLSVAIEAGRLVLWEWHPAEGLAWKSDNLATIFGIDEFPENWSFDVFLNLVHPDDREKLSQHYADHLRSDSSLYKTEYRVVWPDKSVHWVSAQGRTTRDPVGNAERMVGALFDITEQKESELMQIQIKEAAEAANVAKTQFLANMSHEIRTPLAAIMGFAGLLNNPSLTPEKRANFAEAIERNGKALVKLVDDILDISRVESGHVQISKVPFDLVRFFNEIEIVNQFKAEAKGLELRFTKSTNTASIIQTDPHRLRQILLNVIGNAIKFTEKGFVRVDVKIEQAETNPLLVVSVRDTGIGIAPDFHSKLFKPFSQGDSSAARQFAGTGLGLAISQKLANALGGQVKLVRSAPNEGSYFRIEISISKMPEDFTGAEDTNKKPHVAGRLGGLNILVAEDTPDIQILLATYLQQEGALVTVFGNGLEAMRAASVDYDVALIDLQMPGKDGYSIAKALKESGSKLPLIAVTAHALKYEREKCLDAGFAEYLTKPIDFERLTQTILDLS
jgi:signal transduction histidine kinase